MLDRAASSLRFFHNFQCTGSAEGLAIPSATRAGFDLNGGCVDSRCRTVDFSRMEYFAVCLCICTREPAVALRVRQARTTRWIRTSTMPLFSRCF